MENKTKELSRPGPSSSPCFAVLNRESGNLRLVSLNGETSDVLKIRHYWCRDIVTVGGQVYALGDDNIWNISSKGKMTSAIKLDDRFMFARAVSIDKVYVIQPYRDRMIQFDPADKTANYDLPGCKLGAELCCCASDRFIYAMGGVGTETSVMKYDPLTNMWTDIAPMKRGRWNSAAAAASNDRIYVLGGARSPPPEFYDPQTSTWNEISKMNVCRMQFGVYVINDQLFAVGGDFDKDGGMFKQRRSVEVFDGDQWKVVTKFEFESECGVHACVWPHGLAQPDSEAGLGRSRKVFPKQVSHTNQDEDTHEDPELEQSDDSRVTMEKLLVAVTKGIKHHLASQDLRKSKPVGRKGGDVLLPDTYIKVSKGALARNAKVLFSTRTVTDQENGLMDVAPRLLIDSSEEFLIPVSVKMNTTVSGTTTDPISVALHQRDNPREEWRETEQLDIGKENEIDYKVHRGGETKVTISRNTEVKKIHTREDFFINRKTGSVAASFSKDTNIQNATIKSLADRHYSPFDVCSDMFKPKIGTKVTPEMICRYPKKIRISDEVYPAPNFLVDRDFLKQGSRCFYYEFEPELPDEFEKISLLYQCKLDDKLNHKLPLKWLRFDEKQNEGKGKKGEAISATGLSITGNGSTVNMSGNSNLSAGNKGIGENAEAKASENVWCTTIGVDSILVSVAVLVLAIALERFFSLMKSLILE